MRRLPFLATACGLVVTGLTGGAKAQELIVNGGFESFDASQGNLPTGWQRNLSNSFITFGSFGAAPPVGNFFGNTLQNSLPLSGGASLFATQVGPSEGVVWQAITLPRAPLASATLTLQYAAQLGGSTATDKAQIALASPTALLTNPGAATQVLFSVTAANGPVTVPLQTLTLTTTGASLLALRGQPTALAFYVYGFSFPAQLLIDNVSLTYTLAQLGGTPNQVATYGALANATSPGLSGVVNSLVGLAPAQQNDALQRLGAPIYGDALLGLAGSARQFGSAVSEQLFQRRNPGNDSGGGADGGFDMAGYTVWGSAYGGNARAGAVGNTGSSTMGGGMALGADRDIGTGLRLGWTLGAGYAHTAARGTGGSTDMTTGHFGPYLGYTNGPWFADAQLFGTMHGETLRRDLPLGLGRASGQGKGFGASAAVEGGRRFDVAGYAIEPSAGIRVDRINRDGLTEAGGPGAQTVQGAAVTSARTSLGARVSRQMVVGEMPVTLSVKAAWAHELADSSTRTVATFNGSGDTFAVVSARTGRDAAVGQAGASVQLKPNLTAYARYNVEARSHYTAQAGTVGVSFSF